MMKNKITVREAMRNRAQKSSDNIMKFLIMMKLRENLKDGEKEQKNDMNRSISLNE